MTEPTDADRAKALAFLCGLRHYPKHLAGREPSDVLAVIETLAAARAEGAAARDNEVRELCLALLGSARGLALHKPFDDRRDPFALVASRLLIACCDAVLIIVFCWIILACW